MKQGLGLVGTRTRNLRKSSQGLRISVDVLKMTGSFSEILIDLIRSHKKILRPMIRPSKSCIVNQCKYNTVGPRQFEHGYLTLQLFTIGYFEVPLDASSNYFSFLLEGSKWRGSTVYISYCRFL